MLFSSSPRPGLLLFLAVFLPSPKPIFRFSKCCALPLFTIILRTMLRAAGLLAIAFSILASADDDAVSVSTLDFKNRFVESGIVPEVIASLDPAVSFYASYQAEDGHDELLVPGSSLSFSEARMPSEFSVENLGNATNITPQTRFLIYLVSLCLDCTV